MCARSTRNGWYDVPSINDAQVVRVTGTFPVSCEMVSDSSCIRQDWIGSEQARLDWMKLDCRVALDWIVLDWVGLAWAGLPWIGLDWIAFDGVGLDRVDLDWVEVV